MVAVPAISGKKPLSAKVAKKSLLPQRRPSRAGYFFRIGL
jgi:hypothetical protein